MGWVWCALWWFAAVAQDAPVAVPQPTVDTRFDLMADNMVWLNDGPIGVGAFLDVAASRKVGGPLVAIDAEQGVWWAPSPDRRWIRVLDTPTAISDDRASSTLDEQMDLAEVQELENVDDMTSALDGMSGIDDLRDELRMQQRGAGEGVLGGRVWWLEDGRVAAARTDGLFIADEQAVSWKRVSQEQVSAIAEVPVSGTLILGTPTGLKAVGQGSWPSTLDGVEVYDLASSTTMVAAATSDGLFVSVDGKRWTRRELDRPAFTVHGDDIEPRYIWVGTPGAVLRTGVRSGRFRAPVTAAPEMVFDMAFGGDGLLLVAADSGAWVSFDGGGSWTLRSPGLVGAATGVALREDGAWLAGVDGLMRLRVAELQAAEGFTDTWMPLGSLMAASSARVGVRRTGQLRGHSQRVVRYLLPAVQFRGWSWEFDWRDSNLDTGLFLHARRELGFRVNLIWYPPTAQSSLEAAVFQSGDPQDADLSLSGGFSAGNQSGFDNQQSAFALITRLVRDRDTVMRELRLAPPGRTLRDEVHLRLRAREIEAMLDAVTDGAVSRYQAGE